ncbi:Adenosine deaminase-like protein [Operophtera brumata]|uniref:Adenosine deaminase-like protein n=1 Tax=Operophtera brumata TaxID=104452 RepID=A0A0L7KUS2_OPEBR|nr:Adenosine deaminase-like protein [Operophtera brumata]
MDLKKYCRELPKIELHAHLNGSLSQTTMLHLKRYHADRGFEDKTNAFFDEFQIGSGDTRNITDCFQVFSIAHSLTSTPETLAMATMLTLQEFQDDGCCYIELRSTPRETESMSKRQYLETIIQTIQKSSLNLTMVSKLIVSINRSCPIHDAEEIANLAIEFSKMYPDVVTLHCGEVCNPEEVLQMLKYKPDRIGHGVCIHPQYGGTDETWSLLCQMKIPVDYDSHHFRELYDAEIPLIICTDDKGVFATSLSQEYRLCAETFNLTQSQLARLSLNACQFMFAEEKRKLLNDAVLNFINKNEL